jgi:hypothetical protein
MSSRFRKVAIGLTSLLMAAPAIAQIESSGLGDLDAWGASFLKRGESRFGSGLWSNSDPEYLLALFERIDVSALSTAEKELLSRALRSPASAPEGDLADELQGVRLDLLHALGERRAAASLAGQMGDAPDDFNPDIILSDNRLARGEVDIVCAQMNTSGEGRFWSELRAICALKAGEPTSAELAIEIAGQQEGAEPWFTEVAFAMLAEAEDRPPARYGSGLQLTLSDMAGLEPDADSLSADRPDVAAIIAKDAERSLDLRLAAAAIAAEAGLLSASRHRGLYEELIAGDEFEPQSATEAAFVVLEKEVAVEKPMIDISPETSDGPMDLRSMTGGFTEAIEPEDLDEAPLAEEDPDAISVAEEQALAVREALRDATSDPVRFAAAARLFGKALESIPANEDTSGVAPAFAAAALSNGSRELALKWLDNVDADEQDDEARFNAALLRGYALILAAERPAEEIEDIVSTLLETGYEAAQTQDILQLFSVWSAFDVTLPVIARATLAQSEIDARPISSGILLAIEDAQRTGATGEALLTILTQTDGQIETLSGAGLATVLRSLGRMGADADAQALAMDAAQLRTFVRD